MGEPERPTAAKRRGRPTKEQEVAKALAALGIDPSDFDPLAADTAAPDTFEGFRDAFMDILWKRRNNLTDSAFTNALNSLARLAEANKSADNDADSQHVLVADVVSGISLLSAERKREVLTAALAELDAEREQIMGVLDGYTDVGGSATSAND